MNNMTIPKPAQASTMRLSKMEPPDLINAHREKMASQALDDSARDFLAHLRDFFIGPSGGRKASVCA
jgi:hypothetical protein